MNKILKRALLLTLLLTAVFALSAMTTASAATNVATQVKTTLGDGAVVTITNNYMTSDVIEITLPSAATSNTAYWVYREGSTDKSAQLGTITIKKGATSGRLSLAASKLGDFTAGSVNVVTASSLTPCSYGIVATTNITLSSSNVSLRNSASGAEMLIVDSSIVTKGMTASAIVNGKIYKAVAKADGVDLQVNLASNMESGVTVWCTVAAAGCQEADYIKLKLGEVEPTKLPPDLNVKLFFMGDGASTSSVMVFGVKPGDVVRCFTNDGRVKKSATVSGTNTMVTITGLKLNSDDTLKIAITEKGKLESDAKDIPVPDTATPAALKSSSVSVKNAKDGDAAKTTITVKGIAIDDIVTIYNAKGEKLESRASVAPTVIDDPDAEPPAPAEKADVVFERNNLGLASTTIYVSVTTDDGESAWLKVTVPVAK